MFRLARCSARLLQLQIQLPAQIRQPSCLQQRFSYHSLFINPPADEVPNLTISELTEIFATEFGTAKEYSTEGLWQTERNKQFLMSLLPGSPDELPARSMKDSYVTAIVPLRSQEEIRERYVTTDGFVRTGRLLEDMDVFAVYCCFKHIENPKSVGKGNPYSVVTAFVDNIEIYNNHMEKTEDVRLSGHVTYTGKSSMEVCIVADQKDENGVYQKALDAVFLMVARDPMNVGSALINPLKANSPEEEEFLKQGLARQTIRKQQEQETIFKKPPTEEERLIIHDRFIDKIKNPTKALPENTNRMKDCGLKTVLLCHPEFRNRYNKIFGGFIMRQALELAMTNTYLYGKKRPNLIYIDDIKFKLPVNIGSILRFRSHVGYVENNFVHSVVIAEIVDPKTSLAKRSNEFHFSFMIPKCETEPPVPNLDFESYEEAILYLDARRHFKKMMEEFGKTINLK